MDSEKYQAMLRDHLIRFGPLLDGAEWMFLWDNASCHASKLTQERFLKKFDI